MCMYLYTYIYIYIHTYTCICMCLFIYTYIYIYMCGLERDVGAAAQPRCAAALSGGVGRALDVLGDLWVALLI